MEALDASAATVLVSSFHLPTLDRVHERRPALRTGWLVVAAPNDWPTVLADHGHHALHPHHLAVAPGLIAAAKERGFTVNTWTVDDPARMAELAALGVDGIVTNVPDIALRVLGRVYGTTRSRTSGS